MGGERARDERADSIALARVQGPVYEDTQTPIFER
jgi:hypothetical protein